MEPKLHNMTCFRMAQPRVRESGRKDTLDLVGAVFLKDGHLEERSMFWTSNTIPYGSKYPLRRCLGWVTGVSKYRLVRYLDL